jgi:hypothetical protein
MKKLLYVLIVIAVVCFCTAVAPFGMSIMWFGERMVHWLIIAVIVGVFAFIIFKFLPRE